MSKLSERIQNLTPEQQELLRRRRQREAGQQLKAAPPSAAVAVADAAPMPFRPGLRQKVDFSIFFFSADGNAEESQRYRLLLESARFADANGFAASMDAGEALPGLWRTLSKSLCVERCIGHDHRACADSRRQSRSPTP